jgi:hypothetical protein
MTYGMIGVYEHLSKLAFYFPATTIAARAMAIDIPDRNWRLSQHITQAWKLELPNPNDQFLPRPLASSQRDNEKTFCWEKKVPRGSRGGVYIEITKRGNGWILADFGAWGLGFTQHGAEWSLAEVSRSPPKSTCEAGQVNTIIHYTPASPHASVSPTESTDSHHMT